MQVLQKIVKIFHSKNLRPHGHKYECHTENTKIEEIKTPYVTFIENNLHFSSQALKFIFFSSLPKNINSIQEVTKTY